MLMVEKMEIFACGQIDKVILMSDFTRNNWLADQRFNLEPASESVFDDLIADDDLLMEQILDNMNSTPLGQVLKEDCRYA